MNLELSIVLFIFIFLEIYRLQIFFDLKNVDKWYKLYRQAIDK